MDRAHVTALHYIAPVANLSSITQRGLLSHESARRVQHISVALADVQERRARKKVQGGLRLHQYVNLYFHARNSMMYRLKSSACPPLIVLKIGPLILDLPNTVIADGNAASDITRFYPSPSGLAALDANLVFARSWNHEDVFAKEELKRKRSAEVLVPDQIPVEYIAGVIAENWTGFAAARDFGWSGEVIPNVFFQ